MKKLFLIVTIALISFCTKAQYNDLKIGLTVTGLNFSYQRTINENFSTKVGIDFGRYRYSVSSGTGIDGTEVSFKRIGYGLSGEFRAYPFKKHVAPKGFFAGIHIRDFIVEETEPDITVTNNVINAGLNAGYQWVWNNLTMEVTGGYGFSKALSIDPDRNLLESYYQEDLSNFGKFRAEFCIGIIFPQFKKL
jgi:hypothetical protein